MKMSQAEWKNADVLQNSINFKCELPFPRCFTTLIKSFCWGTASYLMCESQRSGGGWDAAVLHNSTQPWLSVADSLRQRCPGGQINTCFFLRMNKLAADKFLRLPYLLSGTVTLSRAWMDKVVLPCVKTLRPPLNHREFKCCHVFFCRRSCSANQRLL